MRVLMTGSSASHVGSDRLVKSVFSMTNALRAALESMGHEVTQRVPDPENDIKMEGHDLIVAGISCIATLGGRWAQDLYWMIDQWNKSKFPMVVYAPDWHMRALQSSVAGIIQDPERIREKSTALGRPHHDWAMENIEGIMGGVQAISRGDWPPFILHRFPWGSEEMLASDVKTRDPWSLDPSGYMPQWPFSPPDLRIDEWTCPRLQTIYDPWLNDIAATVEWPITRFGNQRLQEPQVSEDQIPQILCESSGTLVPPGYHSGSGLWRSRYLIAGWTNTPLYAAPEEGMVALDPAFSVTPIAIEALSARERGELAKQQSQAIFKRVWTRQQMVNRLHELMEYALGRDLGDVPEVPEQDAEPPTPRARVYHPLLERRGPANPRPDHTGRASRTPRMVRPCCAATDLLPDQVRIRGHHPDCADVPKPRVTSRKACTCANWERTAEMVDVRGHHPDCPRVANRTPLTNTSAKHERPRPGEEGYAVFDEKSQMWHRPRTLDFYVIHEVGAYNRMGITADDVVLDLGGHIGGFTVQAASRGARVYAFEPDPENYELLLRNVERFGDRVTVSNRAVISGEREKVELYLNVGSNTGTHSTLASRGREVILVPTEDFQTLMTSLEPTVLKVDIEGGEYQLDWSSMPASVKMICMELHRTKRGLHEKSVELAERVCKLGFEYTKTPKLHGGAWAVLAIWKRVSIPAGAVEGVAGGSS